MADNQTAAEYVVHAIRKMSGGGQRRISIIGHSQGGMVPRYPHVPAEPPLRCYVTAGCP
jgi:hypothetical protein